MEKSSAKPIVATSYVYSATGKTPEGKTRWGKPIDRRSGKTKHTSFKALKKDLFEKSKNSKDVYVEYGPRQVKSVTQKIGKNMKEVTFFKRAK